MFDCLVAVRFVHFGAVFILFGTALFWLYAVPSVERGAAALPISFAATRPLLRGAALVAAASGLLWLAAMLANMTSDGAGIDVSGLAETENWRIFFLETGFGPPWALRIVLFGAALAAAWSGRTPRLRALAAVGAALLVSQAFIGHAAQAGLGLRGLAMLGAYAVHLCAAAAWAGGLPPLLLALRELWRSSGRGRGGEALAILQRFSAMACVAAPLAVAAGAVNAWFRLGDALASPAASGYGRVLLVKIVLVAAMLTLAVFNRFACMPRLRETGDARALRVSVAAELAIGALVLAAAAVLGVTPPPN